MAIINLYERSIFKSLPRIPQATPEKEGRRASATIESSSPSSRPSIPRTGYTSQNTGFVFGQVDISKKWREESDSIYNRYSLRDSNNRLGFDQPYIEVKPNSPTAVRNAKKFDSQAFPLAASIEHNIRIGKFLASAKGAIFLGKQGFLQSLNPTAETKIYNPASLAIVPYAHIERHSTIGGVISQAINRLSGGKLNNLNNSFGARTYGEAIAKIPVAKRDTEQFFGRALHQSALADRTLAIDSAPGIKYADKARGIMAKLETFKNVNPNRNLYPMASDGAGIPYFGRPSPKEEMQRDSGLARLAVKFTQGTGFNRPYTSQVSPVRSVVSGLLNRLVPSIVRQPVSRLLGMEFNGPLEEIKIYNKYNPSFRYALASTKENRGIRYQTTDENSNPQVWGDSDSPSQIIEILNSIANIGEVNASERTPSTFVRQEQLEEIAGEVLDDRVLKDPYTGQNKINRYLQSYGQIRARRKSMQEGGAITQLISDISVDEQKTYEQKKREDSPNIHTIYGIANPGAKDKDSRTPDRVNMLDYGQDYTDALGAPVKDFIPFKFFHVNLRQWIIFRAVLSGVNESVSADWNSKKYIGRPDNVYTYSGANRALNFNFTVTPNSAQEVEPIWRKLNYMTGLCYPNYVNLGVQGAGRGQFMVGPFVRLTIGSMYDDLPGFIESLTYTISDEAGWEIRDERQDADGNNIAQVPKIIEVSVSFRIIGKELYSSTSKFFDPHFI